MNFFNYHRALIWVWDKTDEAAKILFVVIGSFILLENRFKVGDVIKAAGVSGRVGELPIRLTTLSIASSPRPRRTAWL